MDETAPIDVSVSGQKHIYRIIFSVIFFKMFIDPLSVVQ